MRMLLIFRWVTFLLAAGYCVRMVLWSDYEQIGGPFRFLTIWALFLSFFCVSRMIARMEGRSDRRWDALVAATAVINTMVVILYWRLYFADPSSVTRDGTLSSWWLEGYLHGIGPALQVTDAVFLHRAFRRPHLGAGVLLGIIALYVAWAELVLRPFNDAPIGTVTSGLPYPFLNSLEFSDRSVFYATNVGVGLVVLMLYAAVSLGWSRFVPAPEVRQAPRDNPDI